MAALNLQTFTPSASLTLIVPGGQPLGSLQALPSVDSGNTAARITNNSGSAAYMKFGSGSYLPAAASSPGSFVIPPGGVVLVPSAAGAAPQAGVSMSLNAGGTVLFERGTLASATFYDAASMAAQV